MVWKWYGIYDVYIMILTLFFNLVLALKLVNNKICFSVTHIFKFIIFIVMLSAIGQIIIIFLNN